MGTNPEGKKLGILGMGGIGKAIAQRAYGFEMQIQYHNRSRLPEEGM
jgi:lactate dehydrogenase-like 2-hydroxyacid dehydrogenase